MGPAPDAPTEEFSAGYPLREEAREEFAPPPPDPPPRPRKRRLPLSWTLLAVVLLLLAGIGTAYALGHRHSTPVAAAAGRQSAPVQPAAAPSPPLTTPSTAAQALPASTPAAPPARAVAQVDVPRVVGHRLPDAVSLLRQAGLGAVVVHVSSDQPTGRVVGQSPAAGAKQAKGARIRLEVSVQPPVVVPDVVGMKGLAANHTLRADHLVAFLRYVPSSQPARTVVAQHPTAGTKVRRGSHVEINISKGGHAAPAGASASSSTAASVPDVVGEDESTATSDLEAAGLTVDTVQTSTTDPSEDGIVLDQSPAAESKTSASTVTIDVGSYSSG